MTLVNCQVLSVLHFCWCHIRTAGKVRVPINLTFDLKMDFEEQNGRVHYDPIDANYRVYWQGRLMRPTFSTRLAALGYLCALRNGLRKPDFAEQLPSEATKLSSN